MIFRDGGGKALNLLEIAAELVKHFGLRPWDIELLDRWTIAHVYFHPRDKWGALDVSPKSGDEGERSQSPREKFTAWAKSWDWPEWYVDDRWRKMTAPKAK